MSSKESLVNDLRTLPSGYAEFLSVQLPSLPESPSDVDAANIVCGRLAQYLLNVFEGFAGLHLLKVPGHMGQLNETVIGLLLSSLEIAKASSSGDITMLMPVDGGIYYGAVTEVSCAVDGAESVSCTAGAETFALTQAGNTWSSLWAFPIGAHMLQVSATFADGEPVSVSIAFEVKFWTTYPVDGATIAAGSLEATIDPGEDTLESAAVNGVEMIFDAASGLWKATLTAAPGAWELAFSAAKAAAEAASYTIEVIVE